MASCRVLSRIKTLVQDEDNVLDKDEDQHIYAVLKAFMKSDDVKGTSGALSCLQTIERAVSKPPPIPNVVLSFDVGERREYQAHAGHHGAASSTYHAEEHQQEDEIT